MSSKTLCALVRAAAVALAVCGAFLGAYVVPALGAGFVRANPQYAFAYVPWLAFFWAVALPCFVILVHVWLVAAAIGHEEVFTHKVARWIKNSGLLLLGDVALLFVGNVVLLLLGMNHPGMLVVSMLGCMLGLALAVLALAMARYITKAAALQEEADGTI